MQQRMEVTLPIHWPNDGTNYVDVSNSVTGGFSATSPSATTGPFDPQPWSIGQASLAEGSAIPENTTFTFVVNPKQPGVNEYLQRSLATGGLGFFLSSLHLAAQRDWVPSPTLNGLKESAGGLFQGRPATLQIDYEILPPTIAT